MKIIYINQATYKRGIKPTFTDRENNTTFIITQRKRYRKSDSKYTIDDDQVLLGKPAFW
ncbi:MAG: hypothetical protein ACPKPY_05700 [Nitrososphaeraceae archaeon]